MNYKVDKIVSDGGKDIAYIQFFSDDGKLLEKHCLPFDEKFEAAIKARYDACASLTTTFQKKKLLVDAVMAKIGAKEKI